LKEYGKNAAAYFGSTTLPWKKMSEADEDIGGVIF